MRLATKNSETSSFLIQVSLSGCGAMDPLSITVSVVALISVVKATLVQAQALHSTSRDIDQLLNEITNVQIVVNEVQKTLEGRETSLGEDTANETSTNVASILRQVEDKLQALNDVLSETFAKDPLSGKIRYARLTWLRRKPRVREIKTEMERLKLSLTVVCGAASFLDISKIRFRLEEISVANTENHEATDVERRTTLAQRQGSHIEAQLRPSENSSSIVPLGVRDSNIIPTRGDQPFSVDIVSTQATCAQWCSCKCHRINSLSSPEILNKAIGALSIGYSAIPYITEPCSEKQCERSRSTGIRIRYRYPSWLFARAFLVALSSSPGALQVSLRSARVIPPKSEIFRLVISGDLEGVKSMLSQGQASIYDVDDQSWTLIHVRYCYLRLILN